MQRFSAMLYQAGPSSCGGPTERISSFLDLLLQPIAQKQGYYTLYKLHWKHRIPTEAAILATLEVCSFYTNILREVGIEIVCRFYEEHYQPTLPIPTHFLGDLMRLIVSENSFKFNDKDYLQTHGIVMGT